MAALAVILVNYHGATDTMECVRSLTNSTFKDITILVVDNASHDGLSSRLASEFPNVKLLENQENEGFAAGNNRAIKEALTTRPEAIFLLNNDTVVEKDTLAILMGSLRSGAADVLGPKILYHDEPGTIWFAGGFFNTHLVRGGHYGLGEADDGRWDEKRACDYVSGCALLCTREVLEHVGLLDESFFAYLEDVDFCVRARNAGFSLAYEPRARVYHKISKSSSWDSCVYLYFNNRNRLLFAWKHTSLSDLVVAVPSLAFSFVRQFARMALKYRDYPRVRALWLALCDGSRRRTGRVGEGSLPSLLDRSAARERQRS